MPTTDRLITNVSDTARWVATYRATETARSDALFHDHLADRLAGERGHAMVAAAPRAMRNGWWLVARTKVIDDIVSKAIADGCDRILNLAAGLDTRPYRLDLPPELRWVEADLPGLLAEKQQLLAGETPRCRLTTHAVDLADSHARDAFLNDGLSGASKALVLTEGLLMYLEESDVRALSRSFTRPEIAWWMLDFAGPGLQKRLNKRTGGMLNSAPIKFAPANGLAFYEDLGWRPVEVDSVFSAAHRFGRLPLWMRLAARLPQPDPRKPGNQAYSGIVRLTRAR
ncbi:methyltransferase, putative, TIGR00027 family [Mycolicibacterium rhodesiae NBB3]|uniref:S-adenosyl-L-methionine-dependent methyltransferase n=1 Tax=Mycolicibacterium rhodesiae (strain NBB3) TaxID=710685 RepID=G8RWJ7_MYCRN|nr:SAM-dependent methyltransferase [Mycolicibacterium rhodesiae]AEV74305.1 methyltransferase, putative, TIGR00027 family [Mycolicibacterium rhodesiae NBB3]